MVAFGQFDGNQAIVVVIIKFDWNGATVLVERPSGKSMTGTEFRLSRCKHQTRY